MNIKQIETFVRIVELGSFQAAASELHASPSTISGRIKELESFIGFPLFDRDFHRAQPTAKGQELYMRARYLVEYTRSLARGFRTAQAITGVIRLGVAGLAAMTWLPQMLEATRQRFPGASLQVEVGLTKVLMQKLSSGKFDIVVVAGEVADASLHAEALGAADFVWMQAADEAQALTAAQPLGPADIAAKGVLSLGEDSHHYPIMRDWFEQAGIAFHPLVTCNNMAVLAELTEHRLGVALLPRGGFRRQLETGRLREIPTEPPIPSVGFTLVYRKARKPDMADALLEIARQASQGQGEAPHGGTPSS